MGEHKVLITASGLGSRLGKLTSYTNKALTRVGDKPAISYIVEKYSPEDDIVITLGHYGKHVKDFLSLTYPERKFTFVDVKNYSGTGSSLLYSMMCARKELQCPFIFHASDAIILDDIPLPDHNWIAGSKTDSADSYRTLNVSTDKFLSKINEKGEIKYDLAYPGLVGINDYENFWLCLEEIINTSKDSQNSDCHVIQKMMSDLSSRFKIVEVEKWYDIGEPSALRVARESLPASIDVLDKEKESVYLVNNSVVKFFYDEKIVEKRVKRAEVLSGLVPKILGHKDNFFRYEYAHGELFARTVTPSSMKKFLSWIDKNMWSQKKRAKIYDECGKFYFDKTVKRINLYLGGTNDRQITINGENVPPVWSLLDKIDRRDFIDGVPTVIHGDCILDNVIETEDGFTLIDWRQDFAGSIKTGDMYYDLAKLNHNLIFNHDMVGKNYYFLNDNSGSIECDIFVRKNLLDCQEVLHQFIESKNLSLEKVKTLTAIIWINMAPLHEYPLNRFLFNFGKYNLYRQVGTKK